MHAESKGSADRQGVIHFKVKGKRGKIRFVPAHAQAQRLIETYLFMAGHGDDNDGPLFRPVSSSVRSMRIHSIETSSENTGRKPA